MCGGRMQFTERPQRFIFRLQRCVPRTRRASRCNPWWTALQGAPTAVRLTRRDESALDVIDSLLPESVHDPPISFLNVTRAGTTPRRAIVFPARMAGATRDRHERRPPRLARRDSTSPGRGPCSFGVSPLLLDPVPDDDVDEARHGDRERDQGVGRGRHTRHQRPEADHEEQRAMVALASARRPEPTAPLGSRFTDTGLRPREQTRERDRKARRHGRTPERTANEGRSDPPASRYETAVPAASPITLRSIRSPTARQHGASTSLSSAWESEPKRRPGWSGYPLVSVVVRRKAVRDGRLCGGAVREQAGVP